MSSSLSRDTNPDAIPQPRRRKIAVRATTFSEDSDRATSSGGTPIPSRLQPTGFSARHVQSTPGHSNSPSVPSGSNAGRGVPAMQASKAVEPITTNPKQNKAKTYSVSSTPRGRVRGSTPSRSKWRSGSDKAGRSASRMTSAMTASRFSGREKTPQFREYGAYGVEDSDVEEDHPRRFFIGNRPFVTLAFRDGKVVGRVARKLVPQIAMKSRKVVAHVHSHADDGSTGTIDDDHGDQIEERSPSPPADLIAALNALTLSEVKMQMSHRLPFLVRNVRRAFNDRCRIWGIPMSVAESSHGPPTMVQILYTYGTDTGYLGRMHGWACPLCTLFPKFNTREMLDKHFQWDHGECHVNWSETVVNETIIPRLAITIPEVVESDWDTESSSSSSEDELQPETSPEEEAPPPSPPPPLLLRSPTPEVKPFIRGSSVIRNIASPSPVRPSHPPATRRFLRPTRPIDPSDLSRYPTPPPYENLEGPSAVYPYIAPDAYSARPGGPKLYDLLNTLPLEPFGLMSWFIIDKEEEIFDLDDIRDEDKVMQALWARWILLNRNAFIQNYNKGVKSFIDEYWRMIHRAAGFSALRVWLLVLVSNRFLTGTEFCLLLKYYSELVGMDLWK